MRLHTPGKIDCLACAGQAREHSSCKKKTKGVVHVVLEPSYDDGEPNTSWRTCDACGVHPRVDPIEELEGLIGSTEDM